jgi:hypothetical protein
LLRVLTITSAGTDTAGDAHPEQLKVIRALHLIPWLQNDAARFPAVMGMWFAPAEG